MSRKMLLWKFFAFQYILFVCLFLQVSRFSLRFLSLSLALTAGEMKNNIIMINITKFQSQTDLTVEIMTNWVFLFYFNFHDSGWKYFSFPFSTYIHPHTLSYIQMSWKQFKIVMVIIIMMEAKFFRSQKL